MADSFGFAVDDVTQLPSFGIWSMCESPMEGALARGCHMKYFARKESTLRANTVSFSSAIAATEQVETKMMIGGHSSVPFSRL